MPCCEQGMDGTGKTTVVDGLLNALGPDRCFRYRTPPDDLKPLRAIFDAVPCPQNNIPLLYFFFFVVNLFLF